MFIKFLLLLLFFFLIKLSLDWDEHLQLMRYLIPKIKRIDLRLFFMIYD